MLISIQDLNFFIEHATVTRFKLFSASELFLCQAAWLKRRIASLAIVSLFICLALKVYAHIADCQLTASLRAFLHLALLMQQNSAEVSFFPMWLVHIYA